MAGGLRCHSTCCFHATYSCSKRTEAVARSVSPPSHCQRLWWSVTMRNSPCGARTRWKSRGVRLTFPRCCVHSLGPRRQIRQRSPPVPAGGSRRRCAGAGGRQARGSARTALACRPPLRRTRWSAVHRAACHKGFLRGRSPMCCRHDAERLDADLSEPLPHCLLGRVAAVVAARVSGMLRVARHAARGRQPREPRNGAVRPSCRAKARAAP